MPCRLLGVHIVGVVSRPRHPFTRRQDITTLLNGRCRPRPEGPVGPDACHHQGCPGVKGAHHAELSLGGSTQGPSPHRHDDVEADVQRTRAALDQRVTRKSGLAGFMATKDAAAAGLELGCRLLDRPVVGPDHEDRGRTSRDVPNGRSPAQRRQSDANS